MAGQGKDARSGPGDSPAAIYHRYLEAGKLAFQRCGGCGRAVFYPRVLCPFCGGEALAWEESAGRGTVYATTAVYSRSSGPRNVCLVDLEEGVRIMSRVDGVAAPEVEIGLAVRLRVDRTDDGEPIPVFVPVSGGAGGER